MLLSRLKEGITGFSLSNDPNRKLMTARTALELATRGGAAVLGRSDIGSAWKPASAQISLPSI